MQKNAWSAAPLSLTPAVGTAYVWRVSLQMADTEWPANMGLLSPDERERAARFRRPRDGQQFAQTRAALRLLLGRLLQADPAALRFHYGAQGKPVLAAPVFSASLSFNVSHSGDVALIAVCAEGEIGVDIERVRTTFSGEDIARRFFCDAEIRWLHSLPDRERAGGFFRLWTRKEAFLKARGEGLWHDLSRFDVSLSPPRPVCAAGQPTDWFLHDLDPAPGYQAALAVPTSAARVQTWEWMR